MARYLEIGGRAISDDTEAYVVAEIGHNHQGSLAKAKQLISAAHAAGANAAKLQKRHNRTLYTRAMFDRPYVHRHSFGATYGQHRERLELGPGDYAECRHYAASLGITFFATAFDFRSADFLANLGVPAFKIASGDITNIPLIEYVARFGKPVLVSTGMATMDDVARAHEAVMRINPALCLMQCTATYPTAYDDLDLRVIASYRKRFPDAVIGLSDHNRDITVSAAAFALGARVFEKHFTLSREMKGTDHCFSLEPAELTRMVSDLRHLRAALGDGVKKLRPGERPALEKMGKSVVASRNLAAGRVLKVTDVLVKSPGGGLPPFRLESLLGKRLRRSLEQDEALSLDDLE